MAGYGWILSAVLSVERQTEKGFPRYRDSDEGALKKDVFVFRGEELVPLSDGTYRCETENDFRRFRPIRSRAGGPIDSWLVEDPDGTKHWLGRYFNNSLINGGSSRVTNPAPPDDRIGPRGPFETTFAWYEDAAEDVNGNRIEYEYSTDPDSPGVLYLSLISYYAKGEPANARRVSFLYQERVDKLADYRAGFGQTIGQKLSEVAVSVTYGGAARPIRSYALSYDPQEGVFGYLLRSFTDEQKPLELGLTRLYSVTEYDSARVPGSNQDAGSRLPPLRFSYSALYLHPPPQSFLDALQPLRFRLRPARGQIPAESDPLSLSPVQGLVTQRRDESGGAQPSPDLDVPVNDPHVQFADVNGDALPDLLDTRDESDFLPLPDWLLGIFTQNTYGVALNMGGGAFKRSERVASSPGVNLAETSSENVVTLADMTGDGMADLAQVRRDVGTTTYVYKNLRDPSNPDSPNGFSPSPDVELATPADLSFSAPNVRPMDVNFDKKTDLLMTTADGLTAFSFDEGRGWINMGRQDWSQGGGGEGVRREYSLSRSAGELPEHPNPLVHLADMNGDRLLDLVQIVVVSENYVEVRYHPLTGPARWGREVRLEHALPDGTPSGVASRFFMRGIQTDPLDPQNGWEAVQLIDVNGDGLTDVVHVEQNRVSQVYLNCSGRAVAGPYEFGGTPVYEPYDENDPTVLRALDINGNGTTDLVFFNAAGAGDRRGLRYLDFMGGQKAGLLQVLDNGIGSRTFIRYRTSTEDFVRARESGHPWLTSAPNPTWVTSGAVTDIGLDLNGDGDTDKYASSFDYRDGHYDSFEKQFRGFSYAQKVEWGDDVDGQSGLPSGLGKVGAPTSVTRYRFMTGSPDGADNDVYVQSLDAGAVPAVDESDKEAGREEEALKGKPVWEEVADGAALGDEAADFDVCAEKAARAAHSPDPYGPAASRCTPDKYVYHRTSSRWAVRRLYRPRGAVAPKGRLLAQEPDTFAVSGKSVSFAVLLVTKTETVEVNQLLRERFSTPTAPVAAKDLVVTLKSYDYDDYGNNTLVRDEGVVSGPDSQSDDERVTRKEYSLSRGAEGSVTRWMIRFPFRERVEDENGVFAGESQFYYDGPGLVGLPLGQLGGRGLVARVRKRVKDPSAPTAQLDLQPNTPEALAAIKVPGDPAAGSAEWVDVERKAYDHYGNPVTLMDPLGKLDSGGNPVKESGHVRSITYDLVFHTYPTEERIHLGGSSEDLVARAEYERPQSGTSPAVPLGLDVVSRSFDFNDVAADYSYDSFGRLTAIRKSGDTAALPTKVYKYRMADPHRGLLYDYNSNGRLLPAGRPVPAPVHGAASSVRTDTRETYGQAGVLSKIEFTDGAGHSLVSLEEEAAPGRYAVTKAARYGLRGTILYTFQPYTKAGDDFTLPALSLPRSDLSQDALGRVIRTVLPTDSSGPSTARRETRAHYLPLTVYTFDEEDIASSDPSRPHLNTPKVRYLDGLGRMTGVDETAKDKGDGSAPAAPESWPTRYSYDLNDNLVRSLDSQGNQKWVRYDGLGRVLFMNDLDRGSLRYAYDDASNHVETVDAAGQRITFTYDGANRLLTEDYHDDGKPYSAGRRYDPSQPITTSNRPDIIFNYDRVVAPVMVNGTSHLAANPKGRLTHVDDLSGEEFFSYDERGRESWSVKLIRIEGEGQPSTYMSRTQHDARDRVSRVEYPDGEAAVYKYNARGLITKIELARTGGPQQTVDVIKRLNYLPSGQLSTCEYGNGAATKYEYDPRLRLTSLVTNASGPGPAVPLLSYKYAYDGVSNVIRIDDTRPSQQASEDRRNTQLFAYDDLNRLTRVQYPQAAGTPNGGQISYSYDRIGNLLAQQSDIDHVEGGRSVTDLGAMSYGGSLGASRRIGRTTANAGPHALTGIGGEAVSYDANGNVTRLGPNVLTWDFLNRLVAVENDRARAEYVYDSGGRRTVRRVWNKTGGVVTGPPATTKYVDRNFEVHDGGRTLKYVWNGGTRIARAEGTNLTYYHQDHIGSSNLITDASGATLEEYTYYPFGQLRRRHAGGTTSGVSPPDYLFGQKERDQETDFYDFGSRYYSPMAGHFLTADALYSDVGVLGKKAEGGESSAQFISFLEDPQKANLYAYVLRNPLRYSDPTGADPVDQLQITLSVAGMLPGPAGQVFNLTNAMISVTRGDYLGASLSALAAIPAAGTAANVSAVELFGARAAINAATSARTAATVARGGIAPVIRGQAGVAKAAQQIEAAGGKILGREITIQTAAGRSRLDLYAEIGGQRVFVEVKAGAGKLTANQARVHPVLQAEGGVARGQRAVEAGFQSGGRIAPTPVIEMRVQ